MGLDIPIPFLIFIAVFALIGLGMGFGILAERKRREAIRRVADQLGLVFYQDGDSVLVQQLSDLPLFSKGRSRRITNMIRAETDEVIMGVFDYRYTTGSGKNSHTYRQSVAFFRSNELNLPDFELRPQSIFHGIGKIFGYQDIDFDSHPAFAKAFLLRGPSEKQVRAAFDSSVLTTLQQKPGICAQGRTQDLVVYRHSKRVRPDRLKAFMNEGFEVFTVLRRTV